MSTNTCFCLFCLVWGNVFIVVPFSSFLRYLFGDELDMCCGFFPGHYAAAVPTKQLLSIQVTANNSKEDWTASVLFSLSINLTLSTAKSLFFPHFVGLEVVKKGQKLF